MSSQQKNTPAFWGKRSPSWQQLVYNFGQPTGVLAQTQGAVKKLLLRLEVSEECEPLQSHALMIRFMKKQKKQLSSRSKRKPGFLLEYLVLLFVIL